MQFEYPSQRFQDWLSQQWVMLCGQRIDPASVAWLFGPFGDVDEIADHYITRLAADEGLTVQRHKEGAGLVERAEDLLGEEAAGVDERILDFYEHTADYDIEVWSEWNPLFRPGGVLLQHLYSRRLKQLNMPLRPLDTARGISSEIVTLSDSGGRVRYRVWYRVLKSTGQVIYSGIYMGSVLPDGKRCAKVVFPLPRGNATFVLAAQGDGSGGVVLETKGRRFGDSGFYFLLRDSRGRHFAQFIRSFRERLYIYVDDEGVVRADQRATLWGCCVIQLHYKMMRRKAAAREMASAAAAAAV